MIYVFLGLGGAAGLVVTFLWWRLTSVGRGYRQIGKKVAQHLDPLAEKLSKGTPPTAEEVEEVARIPFTRGPLYYLLKHFERLDLLPQQYRTEEAQGVGYLTHWMMHPNELQDPPEAMELVEKADREIGGDKCRFYVFRYRMPEGHWAGRDWFVGLAGPFFDNEPSYEGRASGFSRCDKHGETNVEEFIDWYVGMFVRDGDRWPTADRRSPLELLPNYAEAHVRCG